MAQQSLFPEFEAFANQTQLADRLKGGNLPVLVHRVLGHGATAADMPGKELPSSEFERRQTLARLNISKLAAATKLEFPANVLAEAESVREAFDRQAAAYAAPGGTDRFAAEVLSKIDISPEKKGRSNDRFFAGGLLLVVDAAGLAVSWSLTQYYPMVSKIPLEVAYVVEAFHRAQQAYQDLVLDVESFMSRLDLAVRISSQRAKRDEVLLKDVASAYVVACQAKDFWASPQKKAFVDVPPAAFVANFSKHRATVGTTYELKPAVLHESHGPNAIAFFLPSDQEGTSTRPWKSIRRLHVGESLLDNKG